MGEPFEQCTPIPPPPASSPAGGAVSCEAGSSVSCESCRFESRLADHGRRLLAAEADLHAIQRASRNHGEQLVQQAQAIRLIQETQARDAVMLNQFRDVLPRLITLPNEVLSQVARTDATIRGIVVQAQKAASAAEQACAVSQAAALKAAVADAEIERLHSRMTRQNDDLSRRVVSLEVVKEDLDDRISTIEDEPTPPPPATAKGNLSWIPKTAAVIGPRGLTLYLLGIVTSLVVAIVLWIRFGS